MSKVLDMQTAREARAPHLMGRVRCIACGHEHTSVQPVGLVWVECSACHLNRAAMVEPVGVIEGDTCWSCTHCGCDYFTLQLRGRIGDDGKVLTALCAGCGMNSYPWE